MLLDDVMSELDRDRRTALVELLAEDGGQALITTTDLDHVPGVFAPGVARIAVDDGRIAVELTAERSRDEPAPPLAAPDRRRARSVRAGPGSRPRRSAARRPPGTRSGASGRT